LQIRTIFGLNPDPTFQNVPIRIRLRIRAHINTEPTFANQDYFLDPVPKRPDPTKKVPYPDPQHYTEELSKNTFTFHITLSCFQFCRQKVSTNFPDPDLINQKAEYE
jgi:hypothetical protein